VSFKKGKLQTQQTIAATGWIA